MPHVSTKKELFGLLKSAQKLPACPKEFLPSMQEVESEIRIEIPGDVIVILVQMEFYLRIKILRRNVLIDDLLVASYTGSTSAASITRFIDYILGKLRTELTSRIESLTDEKKKLVALFVDSIDNPKSTTRKIEKNIPEFPQRKNKGMNIVEYINEQWGDVLDGNFTRADLRKRWPRTEQALRNYERKHGHTPLDTLDLPTVQERNERLIKAGRVGELEQKSILTADERRELHKLQTIKSRLRQHSPEHR